jgi:hypothetical protein
MFFFKKVEIIEEEEEEKIISINDIYEELEEEINVSSIFTMSILWTLRNLFKKNTKDLIPWIKPIINIWLHKKLKISKLKRPIFDIKKSKKIVPININDYKPVEDLNTLNLININNFQREAGPYSDIFLPKIPLKTKLWFSFKKYLRKIKWLDKLSTSYLIVFLIFIILFPFIYKWFIVNRVNNIITQAKNINSWDNIYSIEKKIEDMKFSIITLKFFAKPLFVLNYILNINDVNNLKYALNSGSSISDSILDLIFVYKSFNINITQKWFEDFYVWEFFKNSQEILFKSFISLNEWISNLEKINIKNNDSFKKSYVENMSKIKEFRDIFKLLLDNSEVIKNILWDTKKRTYMLVFQNSDEIRPTGWFMWSALIFDIFKWKLEKYEKKDIYALEWGIKPFNEKAPEWINKIASSFWLRDANYYSNVEDSSLKIKEFMDKTPYKIDWIIYINQNIILDFLDYFGWVHFDEVKRELNSTNFSMITSTLVESKLYKTWTLGTPKQILFDFILVFFDELKKKWDYSSYIKLLLNWLNENEVLIYSFNSDENEFLNKLWFKNDLVDTNYLDFNYPVFTSISWNKSDRYIKRTFEKKFQINPDCSINTSLKFTSKHTFNISEELNIKNFLYDMWVLNNVDINSTLAIQGKAPNRQYVRLYLPKNAIVKDSPDYKVKDLPDRKEISFYLTTPLLVDKNFQIDYTISNPDCKKYEYEFVKQPGLRGYDFILYKNWNLERDFYNNKNFIYKE